LGAQMIRSKIILSFHELPQDAVLSLHNSLMQHLKEISSDTEKIIVTQVYGQSYHNGVASTFPTILLPVFSYFQLCMSVVDLSLQMNTWTNPIYSYLNQCNDIPHLILLEILKVFPEEVDTKSIRLGANRRNEIENELSNCARLLNDYLVCNQFLGSNIYVISKYRVIFLFPIFRNKLY
jgi:transportin-3